MKNELEIANIEELAKRGVEEYITNIYRTYILYKYKKSLRKMLKNADKEIDKMIEEILQNIEEND